MKQDENKTKVCNDSLLPNSRNGKVKKLNPVKREISIKRMEQDLEVLKLTPLKPIKL